MLPSEEYAYLKRKYEQEKKTKAQPKISSIYPVGFARATHGMPPAHKPEEQHLRMQNAQRAQPRYAHKKRPEAISTVKKAHPTWKTVRTGQPSFVSTRHRFRSTEPLIAQATPLTSQAVFARTARPAPRYPAPQKPLPVPEYSNAQIRQNNVYRPSALAGKAGEVLGVADKKIYSNKPGPKPKSRGSTSACIIM